MGVFSWCTSDTKKSIPCIYSAYKGAPETVYLLNPFGEPYKETDYQGYGVFGGRDVYELVAEWNRPYLNENSLRIPDPSSYGDSAEGRKYYEYALKRYEFECEVIKDFANGMSDEEMLDKYKIYYGIDWKRKIGIAIACYDDQHVKLRYPIKIVENLCSYDEAQISPSCPFQGCFYGSLSEIKSEVKEAFNDLNKAQLDYLDSLKKSFVSIDDQIKIANQNKTQHQDKFETPALDVEK